jgi:hypothetical protein
MSDQSMAGVDDVPVLDVDVPLGTRRSTTMGHHSTERLIADPPDPI